MITQVVGVWPHFVACNNAEFGSEMDDVLLLLC